MQGYAPVPSFARLLRGRRPSWPRGGVGQSVGAEPTRSQPTRSKQGAFRENARRPLRRDSIPSIADGRAPIAKRFVFSADDKKLDEAANLIQKRLMEMRNTFGDFAYNFIRTHARSS
jgi:hypothetical protein